MTTIRIAAALVALAVAGRALGGAAQTPASVDGAQGIALYASETADVPVVVFCDFDTVDCARTAVVLRGLVDMYPDRLAVLFRYAGGDQPASRAAYAALAAAAAQRHGWPMFDMMLANQDRLTDDGLRSMAAQLGLDVGAFGERLRSAYLDPAFDADRDEAVRLGIAAGPAIVIAGALVRGAPTLEDVKTRIAAHPRAK